MPSGATRWMNLLARPYVVTIKQSLFLFSTGVHDIGQAWYEVLSKSLILSC